MIKYRLGFEAADGHVLEEFILRIVFLRARIALARHLVGAGEEHEAVHRFDRPAVFDELIGEEVQQLTGQLRARGDPLRRLHHGLDLLAPVGVRDAEDRHVADGRVAGQLRLDLRRVDVDAAGDDHV